MKLNPRIESGCGFGSSVEQVEEFKPGDIHGRCGIQIGLGFCLGLQFPNAGPRAKKLVCVRQTGQLVQWRLDQFLRIRLPHLTLGVHHFLGKLTWAV